MALSTDDLDALELAIASGVMIVQYTDKKIQYNSVSDMFKAREFLRRKLGLSNQDGQASRIVMTTRKGLGDGGYGESNGC